MGLSASLQAEGKDVDLKTTPEAVQQAVAAALQGGKVDDVEAMTREGKTYYKVDVDRKGADGKKQEISLFLNAEGEVLRTKEDSSLAEAPAAVQAAAKALEATEGKVDDVDKITKGDKVSYMVEFDNDKKHLFDEKGEKLQFKKKQAN